MPVYITKINKCFFAILVLFLVLQNNVNAHSIGQPSSFKVNGQYVNVYPVYSSSTPNFSIPKDIAPENYLINKKINFEIDTRTLTIPQELINKTEYSWDFGDGQKASGLKNEHIYEKMGTYILTIYADNKTDPKQDFETIALNILPDTNYKLPQSKIKANNKESKDPLTDIIKVDFSKEVEFNTIDTESTAKIVSYFWDFGDGQYSTEKNVKHLFHSDLTQAYPLLQIADENGFISTSYVQLENQKLSPNIYTQNQNSKLQSGKIKYLAPVFIFLAVIVIIIYKAKTRKNG